MADAITTDPTAAPTQPATAAAAAPVAPAQAAPVAAAPAPAAPKPSNPYAGRPAPKPATTPAKPSRAERLAISKLEARVKELEPLAARSKAGAAALSTFAASAIAELSTEQQAAVRDRAGDDPTSQLETIAWMRKHKMLGAPASTVAPVHAKPGATTSPAGGTAPAPAPTDDADSANFNRWREMKSKGAHLAANAFRDANRASVEAGAKKAEAKLATG